MDRPWITKRRLSSLLTTLFLGAFAWYAYVNADSFRPLLAMPALILLWVGLAKLANHVINGLFMKWTVEVFTGRMRLIESVYVASLSAIGNFFGPLLGGTTIRAVYLNKVHALPYSYFTSTLAGYYLVLFSLNCVLALLALPLLDRSPQRLGLLAVFGAWLAVLILLMIVRLPDRSRLKRLDSHRTIRLVLNTVYEIETGWHRLRAVRGMLPKLFLLAFATSSVAYATALVEFRAIHASISVAALWLYTVISMSSMLINLTPGAIGIRESLLLLTCAAMNVSNDQILQVSVIDRGVSIPILFVLYAALRLLKRSMLPPEKSS